MSPAARSPGHVILTPDFQLRVFISSTLKEMEAERRAVQAAVRAMHLAPVMFGARGATASCTGPLPRLP